MTDELQGGLVIGEPIPGEDVAADDAEPEGAVEITPGRRMVDVSVVASERKKARENTAKTIRESEVAPLKAKADKADQLQQALDAARPYVDLVKQNPQLLQPKVATSAEAQITDADAEQEARDLQLYKADSTLDTATAKKIIVRRRTETKEAALAAAREVAAPLQERTAEQASRQNFAAMCSLKDSNGDPLIDPKVLAEEWVLLPADLTQHAQVAETVLNSAIGKLQRTGKRVKTVDREPIFTESSGGRSQASVTMTDQAKKLGLTNADLQASQKTFTPGGSSPIGDWK